MSLIFSSYHNIYQVLVFLIKVNRLEIRKRIHITYESYSLINGSLLVGGKPVLLSAVCEINSLISCVVYVSTNLHLLI